MNLLYDYGIRDGDKFKIKLSGEIQYSDIFMCHDDILYNITVEGRKREMEQHFIIGVINGKLKIDKNNKTPTGRDLEIVQLCKEIFGKNFVHFHRNKYGNIICSDSAFYKTVNNEWNCSNREYRSHCLSKYILDFIQYDDREEYKYELQQT